MSEAESPEAIIGATPNDMLTRKARSPTMNGSPAIFCRSLSETSNANAASVSGIATANSSPPHLVMRSIPLNAFLRVLSDWGRCGQGAPAHFYRTVPRVTRFSSRSALGPPHDGVRRARRLNLFHDLANLGSAGSGLSTRSPRPSSPRNDPGIALSDESFVRIPCSFDLSRVTPPVRQAPCQSGTRLRRPTCGAG